LYTQIKKTISNSKLEIFNVEHAFEKIREYLLQSTNKTDFDITNCAGEMHVYDYELKRQMRFIQTN
jgi:hypothetical protein